jgi:hypothetical protein
VDSIIIDDKEVNSIPIDNILSTYGDQNITRAMTFKKPIRFGNLYAMGLYDSIDLADVVKNGIYLTQINKIPWKTHFEEIVCGGGIVIQGPVNGVSDYGAKVGVTSGRTAQRFSGDISFDKLVLTSLGAVSDLIAIDSIKVITFKTSTSTSVFVEVTDSVNIPKGKHIGGMDFDTWEQQRVSLTRNEHIYFRFDVDGLVKASKDININEINEVPISDLYKNTLRSDSPEIKFSEYIKLYSVQVENGNIYFANDVSGYSLDEIASNAFPVNSSETIILSGHWHFQVIMQKII